MYYKKYESERLYLSPRIADDYQIYTKWMNDESLGSGLGTFKTMFTELAEKEWIENACKKDLPDFSLIRKEDNKIIGAYGLELKDGVARRYHVGGFIGEKEDRGKGYGTEALMLITKYAFEILNAETLFSGIYEFNEASLKAAKKAGYSVVGKFRKSYFYGGKLNDEYMVEITKEDYKAQNSKN